MDELLVRLARLEEKHVAAVQALANHEKVCGERYAWILKVVIGSTSVTVSGIGALALMLLQKVL